MMPSEFYHDNFQKAADWMSDNAPDYVLKCYAECEAINLDIIIKLTRAVIEYNKSALKTAQNMGSDLPLEMKEYPAVVKMENMRLENLISSTQSRLDDLKLCLEDNEEEE